MVHVDDLIEPGAKQILLARLPSFPWPHLVLRRSRDTTENHESNLQGIAGFRQIRFPQNLVLRFQINGYLDTKNPARGRVVASISWVIEWEIT